MRAALVLAAALAVLPAAPPPAAAHAAAQPAAGVIAYTRDPDGRAGPGEPTIYVARQDGSGERAFATGSAPSLPVGGATVAYAARRGGALQLLAGRLDDPASIRQLTALPDKEAEYGPGRHGVTGSVWSPERGWLALRLTEGSTTTLGLVRASGGAVTRLEFGHLFGSLIAWRDERSLAVGTDTGPQLVTVDGEPGPLPGGQQGDTPVAWLSDVHLVVNDADGITVVDTAKGGRSPALAGATGHARTPAGDVLYTRGAELGVLDPATGKPARLATLPAGTQVLAASADVDPPLLEVADANGAVAIVTLTSPTVLGAGPFGQAGPAGASPLRRVADGGGLTLSNAAAYDDVAFPAAPTTAPPTTAAPSPTPTVAPTTARPTPSPTPSPLETGFALPDYVEIVPRSRFVETVPAARDVSTDGADVGTSLLLTALLMLLITFPAELFNSTLEEHYDEVRGWFRLRPARPPAARPKAARVALFAAYTAVAALLYALLDPGFALDEATARLYLGLAIGLVVVTLAFGAAPLAYARRRYGEEGVLRVLPGTLAVGAVCVLVSRLASFEPGYLYGVVGGFAFTRAFTREEEGRNSLVAAVGVLGLSLLAWLLWQPVDAAAAAARGETDLLLGVTDSTLAAVAVGGIEGLVIGLLPLRSLQGYALSRWSRPAWAGAYGVALFLFVHLLLRGGGDETSAPFLTWLGLFVGFGVVSVAFWGWFRLRPAPAPPGA